MNQNDVDIVVDELLSNLNGLIKEKSEALNTLNIAVNEYVRLKNEYIVKSNAIRLKPDEIQENLGLSKPATEKQQQAYIDDKLKDLARADARGIARYYGLKNKEDRSVLEPLSNVEEKKVLVVDEDYRHNIISYETYFTDREDKKEVKKTGRKPKILIENLYNRFLPYLQIR